MYSKGRFFFLNPQMLGSEKAEELAKCLEKRGFLVEFVNVI